MKKILVIPDLHEKNIWEKIINEAGTVDKIVFLGDYVDSWTHEKKACLDNLENIIEFKKQHMDSVELLLGNHDIAYMYYPNYACSGFQKDCQYELQLLFSSNSELFKISFAEGNYLFSHAGISIKWFEKYKNLLELNGFKEGDVISLNKALNQMKEGKNLRDALFEIGEARGGMRYDIGGPLWADISETTGFQIPNINQIIGHSKVPKVMSISFPNMNCSNTYVDCLDKYYDYLVLEI